MDEMNRDGMEVREELQKQLGRRGRKLEQG